MCINTGGEKVFPEEVEDALNLQPGVEDAMALGTLDADWDKAVVALIASRGVHDEAAVRDGLKAGLPRHASGKSDYRRGAAIVEAMLA